MITIWSVLIFLMRSIIFIIRVRFVDKQIHRLSIRRQKIHLNTS